MLKKSLNFIFAGIFILASFVCAAAQGLPDASTASGRPDPTKQTDLSDGIKESLAKQRIKKEEKDYQELIKRGEEAAQLGAELNKSLEAAQNLLPEDEKKLDRLEKIVKKIRVELGAEDDKDDRPESKTEKSSNARAAVKKIQEETANLLSEIKKIGRHSISVVAIENSNSLIKLVRFLRFNKNWF